MEISQFFRRYSTSTAIVLWTALSAAAQTATPVINSVVGSGTSGFAGDGGPAAQAQIDLSGNGGTTGLAFDSAGNLYISDSGNYRIRKVAPDGTITTVAGDGDTTYDYTVSGAPSPAPAASLPLFGPGSIVAAKDGTVYFLDYGVASISPSGTLSQDTTQQVSSLGSDMTIDSKGNIYITGGLTGPYVFQYAPGSSPLIVAGNAAATGASGGDGGPATKATFTTVGGIATDSSGNVYVVDSGASQDNTTDVIRKFAPGGNISVFAGSYSNTASQANGQPTPLGDGGPATQAPLQIGTGNGTIAFDASGNLYVSEAGKYRVRKIDTHGIITTVAGNGSKGLFFGAGGPPSQAIVEPQNLTLDSSGNLYIANVVFGAKTQSRILEVTSQTPAGNCTASNTPTVGGVSSAAAVSATITPGGFISIYGANFGTGSGDWSSYIQQNSSLPSSLNGVSVTIDGNPAAIAYSNSGQINALVPDDSNIGTVSLTVSSNGCTSAPFNTSIAAATPEFFVLDGTHIIGQHSADYSLIVPVGSQFTGTPATSGETVILYGTGFGATNPPTPSSQLVTAAAPLAVLPVVTIGGVPATVLFAGVVGVGLVQLNVTIPTNVPSGDQPIVATISVDGTTVTSATTAVIPIQ